MKRTFLYLICHSYVKSINSKLVRDCRFKLNCCLFTIFSLTERIISFRSSKLSQIKRDQ